MKIPGVWPLKSGFGLFYTKILGIRLKYDNLYLILSAIFADNYFVPLNSK